MTAKIEIPQDELERYYLDNLLSVNDIARLYNCRAITIRRKAQEFGFNRKRDVSRLGALRRYNHNDEVKVNLDKDRIAELYTRNKMTLKGISLLFHLRVRTIKEILNSRKIEIRQGGPGKGKLHHSWKGGRTITSQGYILIRVPNHPRAQWHNGVKAYVFEHILVWEQTNNRSLPNGWIVHHLNGIKSDNRPENLLGMPKSGHSPHMLLRQVQARVRELEAVAGGASAGSGPEGAQRG